ncbi:MAG: hypothetical protein ACYDHT_04265 [Solirubrobacteraceae bacterium]
MRLGARIGVIATAACCLLLGAAVAVADGAVARAPGKTLSLTCRGGGSSCTAVVSLAGGASNEKLRIALSDTNLKLVGVTAKPGFVHGAYQLSRGSYSLGGSLYTATLNAVQSIPKGATLTLRFAVPTQARSCGSVTKGITHLSVARLGAKQGRGLFSCQQANAVSNTWLLRFNAHESVSSFSVNEVRYTCKLVPTLPQNTQCEGGGTRVKFSAPTGP